MTTTAELFWKAERVIKSCETKEQVKLAERYLFLLARRIPKVKNFNKRKLRVLGRYSHFKNREDRISMSRLQKQFDAKKLEAFGLGPKTRTSGWQTVKPSNKIVQKLSYFYDKENDPMQLVDSIDNSQT